MIFEQVKIPINLYHIPFASGVPISHDLLHSLEKYPNLAGIKDQWTTPRCITDLGGVSEAEYADRDGREFEVCAGPWDGAILAEGNNFTKQMRRFLRRSGRGRISMRPSLS